MIWMGIKLVTAQLLSENPGEAVSKLKFFSNIREYRVPVNVAWTQSAFAFGCLWLMIPFGWSRTPHFMKRLFWVVPPVLFGMLLVANLYEVRVFAERVPVITGPNVFGLSHVAEKTRWH